MFEDIRMLICEKQKLLVEEVQPESSLTNDLHMDSLDVVELVMEVENEFKISIGDEASDRLRTVQDLVTVVEKLTKT